MLRRLLLLLSLLATGAHAQTISVNRDCVTAGEEFAVTFVNVDPHVDDWIGIVPTSESTAAFSTLGTWVWSCGTMDCLASAPSGRVRILAADIAVGSWVAVLSRGAVGAPWSAYAVSNVFTVADSCDGSAPVPSPTGSTPTTPSPQLAREHLDAAWGEIQSIIDEDFRMAPQFLRMAFHDCVGGCDGCIDLDHHDNAGISPAMNALRPIVARHTVSGLISRADIWALAATVATDVTQRDNSRIDFSMNWFGRVDCENTGNPCLGADGTPVVCMDAKGPHRDLPGKDMHTHDLYSFFETQFGFSQRETVVIMGAHTLGVVRKEDFGIDGSNGWVLENDIFDNGYYHELVGGTSINDSVEVMVNEAPAWRRIIENAIRFWVGFPSGVRIIMLNTDISLVRNLDESNMDKALGRVTCAFEDNTSTETLPVCPHVEGALQAAAEFMHDNILWLEEFRDVLDRMVTNGYGRPDCNDDICPVAVL